MLTISFLAAGSDSDLDPDSDLDLDSDLDPAPAPADDTAERGITLQTLIVTAVLVLMAVAAGVVIVAITGSSSDDLEESGSELEARCSEVEIYDPEVAARTERGTNFDDGSGHGGVKTFRSERLGCVPVCVWVNAGEQRLEPGEVEFHRRGFPGEIDVVSGIPSAGMNHWIATGSPGEIAYFSGFPIRGVYRLTYPLAAEYQAPQVHRIAVAPNQNECHTYDAGGNVLLG